MTKQELRKHIRNQKRQFSSDELAELSLRVIGQLLNHPRVINSRTILLYHSLPDEPSTHRLIDILTQHSSERDIYDTSTTAEISATSTAKTVLLPRVVGEGEMEVRVYGGIEDLREGAFGILEPCGRLFTDYSSIDTAIIPGMAFDSECHRLGRGKGYYDRFLAHARDIYKIGVCFPFQLVDHVPTEETDVRMDEIITGE